MNKKAIRVLGISTGIPIWLGFVAFVVVGVLLWALLYVEDSIALFIAIKQGNPKALVSALFFLGISAIGLRWTFGILRNIFKEREGSKE